MKAEKYKIREEKTKKFETLADELNLTRTIIHNLFIQLSGFILLVFKYFQYFFKKISQ